MTRKLTIATVAFFCLLGGLAYAAGSASADVTGQTCSRSTAGKPFRMAADTCWKVGPYGSVLEMPNDGWTEIDVWIDGKRRLPQTRVKNGWNFGKYVTVRKIGKEAWSVVNGHYRTVHVYLWY